MLLCQPDTLWSFRPLTQISVQEKGWELRSVLWDQLSIALGTFLWEAAIATQGLMNCKGHIKQGRTMYSCPRDRWRPEKQKNDKEPVWYKALRKLKEAFLVIVSDPRSQQISGEETSYSKALLWTSQFFRFYMAGPVLLELPSPTIQD